MPRCVSFSVIANPLEIDGLLHGLTTAERELLELQVGPPVRA
jgi:hypothetical protein